MTRDSQSRKQTGEPSAQDRQELAAMRSRIQDLEQEVDRLSTLLDVTSAVGWQLNLDRLLDLILSEVTRSLEADRSTLFLLDRDRMELVSRVAQGSMEIRIPVTKGVAGHVALTGESLRIDDAYEDTRFNRDVDAESGYRTRSILAVPLRNREGLIIGVIEVLNKRQGSFSEEDRRLLAAMATQMAVALENAQLYTELKETYLSFVETLAAAIDAKHPSTSGHSRRVQEYALAIARQMQISEEETEVLAYAAMLHDLGKIGVDDSILKKPGKLTDEEYEQMKQHPIFTRRILESIHLAGDFKHLPRMASAHHERLDGSGYPEGLSGDDIPMMARIIAVADVFDALTHWREYRSAMDGESALEELRSQAGALLDSSVIDAFEKYYRQVNLGEQLAERKRLDDNLFEHQNLS